MNITIQTIVNAKAKHTSSISFKSIPSSSTRMRLSDDRVLLNKIKPLDKILFKVKNISFYMICCPIGTFTMGTDETEYNNPKRTEKIEQPFLLGETEVTQELYEAVMGYNPSSDDDDAQKPVEYVTWYDAVMFCNKLSQLLGKTTYYQISNIKNLEENKIKTNNIESADVEINLNANGFRLPTEKEWEYAAKAWTNNKWAGCDIDDNLTEYASFDENSSETCPVQTRWPNEWGFYDMSGNVWEWCSDKYNSTSDRRVCRGGGWYSDASYLRSAYRHDISPGDRGVNLGFRVSAYI